MLETDNTIEHIDRVQRGTYDQHLDNVILQAELRENEPLAEAARERLAIRIEYDEAIAARREARASYTVVLALVRQIAERGDEMGREDPERAPTASRVLRSLTEDGTLTGDIDRKLAILKENRTKVERAARIEYGVRGTADELLEFRHRAFWLGKLSD